MLRRAALSLCRSVLSRYDAELVRTPRLATSRRSHIRSHEDRELFRRALAAYSHDKTKGAFVRFFMLFTQARRVVREGIEGDFAELGMRARW